MKILQISTYFHPSVGGVERQVEEIAVHLSYIGHEVEVLTTDAKHGKEKRMPQMRQSEDWRGIQIKRFKYNLRLGNFFRLSLGLIFYVWRSDFELIHIHNTHDGHLLPLLWTKFIHRKKIVLTGHNPYVVDAQKRGGLLNNFVKFYDFVFRISGWLLDGYVALLKSEAKFVKSSLKINERKVVVIPNGIQQDFYEDGADADQFYTDWEIDREKWRLVVGTASRLNFVKGVQNLKQAVKRLPDVLFVFAGGDDGYFEQLKSIYRNSPNVLFTERYLPTNEIKNFYAGLDLFLLPSIYEPFGMTVVESLAVGTPVLATNKGGTTEILKEEFGFTLDPLNQEAWFELIQSFAQNPEKILSMRTLAKEAAQKYRWSEVIPQLNKFYLQLSSKKA